jgi:hypothetical protein
VIGGQWLSVLGVAGYRGESRGEQLIGLNFGHQSDWYQNIKAAGACRMRLGANELALGAPTLVPVA